MGKANSDAPKIFRAKKLVNALNVPVVYASIDSVSGCFQHLTKVGTAANKSLVIAKIIATKGCLVMAQRTKANNDKLPQI